MASLNKVMLIGNLGKDPEIRYTQQTGTSVCNFSVATTDKWTDKQGERHEKTEWHDCHVFDRTADLMMEYCKAGTLVYIEGSLQTRDWEDPISHEKKYRTEVKAKHVSWLHNTKQLEDHE
jgi:single-strand DNA-binding protein|tara:strand:+ start:247 stop:606 length:360 start_codon:yes stop_codon:yes gene_type:complete